LDMAIKGSGFFKVKTFDGIGGGEGYTRAGNFTININGDLVLGTADGPLLDPPINIPEGADQQSITIQSDGIVTVHIGDTEREVGQIELYRFPNPHGLRLEGGNIFTETEASGSPTVGNPTEEGFGSITQRYLESSNVDTVKELIRMIRTQRHFELNSQVIRAADEMMQAAGRFSCKVTSAQASRLSPGQCCMHSDTKVRCRVPHIPWLNLIHFRAILFIILIYIELSLQMSSSSWAGRTCRMASNWSSGPNGRHNSATRRISASNSATRTRAGPLL
ncbi:MAG: flagellar hook-basal body complex protein, partial [Proteobacteria bacterium]|nr:flagellar hook-basal body complex protein [Pseudomonadota bacterium]